MSCSSSVFGTVRLILFFFIICINIRFYCFFFCFARTSKTTLLKNQQVFNQIILILWKNYFNGFIGRFSLTSFASEVLLQNFRS
jgi:hypothetical protein